jgi:hypothetical protein
MGRFAYARAQLKGQRSPTAMALTAFRNRELSRLVDADGDEMLMEKKTGQSLLL